MNIPKDYSDGPAPKLNQVVADFMGEDSMNYQVDEDGSVYRAGERIGNAYTVKDVTGVDYYRFKPDLTSEAVQRVMESQWLGVNKKKAMIGFEIIKVFVFMSVGYLIGRALFGR